MQKVGVAMLGRMARRLSRDYHSTHQIALHMLGMGFVSQSHDMIHLTDRLLPLFVLPIV